MPTAPAPDGDLTVPITRLTAVAALALPGALSQYKPTRADRQLAGALFSSKATTLQELADASGISDSSLGRILESPERCAWVVLNSCEVAKFHKREIVAVILQRAVESKNPTWARLALEIVDPDFRRGTAAGGSGAVNTQINFVSGMSNDELQALAGQLVRRQLGCQANPIPASPTPSNASE